MYLQRTFSVWCLWFLPGFLAGKFLLSNCTFRCRREAEERNLFWVFHELFQLQMTTNFHACFPRISQATEREKNCENVVFINNVNFPMKRKIVSMEKHHTASKEKKRENHKSPLSKNEWSGVDFMHKKRKSHLSNVIHFMFILVSFNFLNKLNVPEITRDISFLPSLLRFRPVHLPFDKWIS